MITKSNFSLPYPALGLENDFKEGEFSVRPAIYSADGILHLKEETVEITNEYVRELFERRMVSTAYKIDCSSTLFSYCSYENKHIEIPLISLANSIKVEVFLVATTDIETYSSDSFNDDYFLGENNGVFQVQKGNIIGFAGYKNIPLNETYTAGGSSIFKFTKMMGSHPVLIDVEDSKIEVIYPDIEEKLNIINTLPRTKRLTFLNLFIVPALQQAFSELKDAAADERSEEYIQQHKWAYILSEGYPDYFKEDPYASAQNYLQKLLHKGSSKESYTPVLEAFFNELS